MPLAVFSHDSPVEEKDSHEVANTYSQKQPDGRGAFEQNELYTQGTGAG
jgi:hypothetical protein